MIANLYSLKDCVAEFYGNPFCCNNDTSAIRAVEQQVNRGQGMLGEYPEHFQVWKIGEWDDSKGVVKYVNPELVAHCSAMKRRELVDIVSPDLRTKEWTGSIHDPES